MTIHPPGTTLSDLAKAILRRKGSPAKFGTRVVVEAASPNDHSAPRLSELASRATRRDR